MTGSSRPPSLIPEKSKDLLHYKIGQLLLSNFNPNLQDEYIFDIVSHLNTGIKYVWEAGKMEELAMLNLKSGKRAMQANAIQSALIYFKTGMDLQMENQSSDLFKELLIGASECNYLIGQFDESEKLFDQAL